MRRFVLNHACGMTVLAVLVLASGCAEKEFAPAAPSLPAPSSMPSPAPAAVPPAAPPETAPKPPDPATLYRESGTASWFGREFHGRKTARGEVVDMEALSAFHRTLPLGAIIRVTNADNLKSVTVRVIDRGPFVADRILELSHAAARELGFAAQGTARVTIEGISFPPAPPQYTVQAAVFSEQENANLLKDRLSKKYETITILPVSSNLGTLYRVRIGSYATEGKAAAVAAKLKLEGLEPFVIRKD